MSQNKQKITSEYTKAFKMYSETAQAEYSENVKFRMARRNQEVAHQPWAWLDIDLSDDESENSYQFIKIDNNKSNNNQTNHIDVHVNHSPDEVNSNFDASGAPGINEDESDQGFISKLKKRAIKRAMEIRKTQTYKPVSQNNQSNNVPKRPHHPLKGKSEGIPKSSMIDVNKKKSDHKPPMNLNSVNRDKMFLSYGWGSQPSEGSQKKTFNIKSDIDVYPSAIRALKSRENVKHNKNKFNTADNIRPRTAGNSRSSRSIDLDNRAAMQWLSEYQFRFPIYDSEVYKRGLLNLAQRGQSARLDTPRTCRI